MAKRVCALSLFRGAVDPQTRSLAGEFEQCSATKALLPCNIRQADPGPPVGARLCRLVTRCHDRLPVEVSARSLVA